jgi:membrane-bound lytic murein transglycosylase A
MDLGRKHAVSVEVRGDRTGLRFAFLTVVVGLLSACAPAVRQPPARATLRHESGAQDEEVARTRAAEEAVDPAPATRPVVTPGPSFGELSGWMADDHQAARDAFRRSCAVTTSRTDTSGLTEPNDWRDACAAAAALGPAREFFERNFTPVVVEDGTGLHTGYYEPEISASRTRSGGFRHAIYKRPSDMIVVASDGTTPVRYCARWDGTTCIPYFTRSEIEDGALAGRRLEIAYASDPYELFFMQMQGSGRLRLSDGSFVRIGFDGHNGREWVSIARTVKNELHGRDWPLDTDGILAWLRAHPQRARALMREDASFVFFRELRQPTSGPLGAIHVPLTAERSLAADPKFVPLGAPVWVASQIPSAVKGAPPRPLERLFVAQDTGGAIRGPNRFDVFFGSGEKARAVAGKMFHRGQAIVLLPTSAALRIFGPKT